MFEKNSGLSDTVMTNICREEEEEKKKIVEHNKQSSFLGSVHPQKIFVITLSNNQLEKLTKLEEKVRILERRLVFSSLKQRERLEKVKELVNLNEKVTVSMVLTEFGLKSRVFARRILQDTAKAFDLFFFKGIAWNESFLAKENPENKVIHAFESLKDFFVNKRVGTSVSLDVIKEKFRLSQAEVMGLVSRFSKVHGFRLVSLRSGKMRLEKR